MTKIAQAIRHFLLVALFLSTPVSAQTPEEIAKLDVGYTTWRLNVPPESIVRIKSDLGNFHIPIGYLNARLRFRKEPFAFSNSLARFDVAKEQTWIGFTFNFWVPDGGMVWHDQPQVRRNRPIEPGHPSRSKDSFVVLMRSIEFLPAKNYRRGLDKVSSSLEKLDVVLPARPVFPAGDVAFEGVTRDPLSDKMLRFYVSCPSRGLSLCEGWLIIDRRKMAMSVAVPPDATELMFDAVRIASRLLDTWEDAAQ